MDSFQSGLWPRYGMETAVQSTGQSKLTEHNLVAVQVRVDVKRCNINGSTGSNTLFLTIRLLLRIFAFSIHFC